MKRLSKYGNRKVKHDGHTFDSQVECDRYCFLKLLQKQGDISGLVVHPRFELSINGRPILSRSERYPSGRTTKFTPDFRYLKEGAGVIVEDVKSKPTVTEAFLLRRAIFEAIYYPVQVEIILR